MAGLLEEPFVAVPPPLRRDEGGTIRVGETRVTLETVVGAWQDGETAEEIGQHFDTLRLADVYAVIAYYLVHQEPVDAYLREREARGEETRRRIEAGSPAGEFRERLLARQRAGRRSEGPLKGQSDASGR